MNKKIRLAKKEDIVVIVSIYNEAIRAGFQTADLEELSAEDRLQWFEDHLNSNYKLFVLEVDEHIVGWVSLSPYRKGRGALKTTAEISYYLISSFQSIGLGSYMMEYALEMAKLSGFKNVLAILLDSNKPSIALLKKFGFSEWGRLLSIALINNQHIDHLYFGLKL